MLPKTFNRSTFSQWLLPLLPLSLVISKRLNVLVILLYAVSVVWQPDLLQRIRKLLKMRWVGVLVLFYLLHVLSVFWSANDVAAWFVLEKKAALLVIPILIGLDSQIDFVGFRQCMLSLVLSCCFSIWFCLLLAFRNYFQTGEAGFFFYHAFGWPLDELNAIYFSFFTFTGLVFSHYLTRINYSLFANVRWQVFLFFTLLMGLALLSSRLFIVLTLLYLLRLAFQNYAQVVSKTMRGALLAVVMLFLGGVLFLSQIRDRFDQLLSSQFEVLQQDQFAFDTPFNGLTIRLLLWRFGGEVMMEEKAFVLGTGVGDAQDLLDQTIVAHNLYHGNPDLGDTGYLGYNFHNQFVETWVQLGVVGLLLWLVVLSLGWRSSIWNWNHPYLYFMLAVLAFSMIESLLERQHGIVFLALFISIFQTTRKHEAPPKPIT